MEEHHVSGGLIVCLFGAMIFAGSGMTIVAKLMSQEIDIAKPEGHLMSQFNHPIVMSFLMFIGEAILLPINKLMKLRNKKDTTSDDH